MKPNFVLVDKNFKKPTKKKIICSKEDWKRMDKEEALQKECKERSKLKNPLGKNAKYVWLGIKNTTDSS